MNGDPIARTSEDCTCLRSGYSHSYACRERLIDRQRAEIEQLTRERDAMQRRAESAEADWMALSQDDGKVERALERSEQENDRLRALLSEVLPQHVDQPRGWSGEWNGSEENTWVGRVRAELSGEHSAHETSERCHFRAFGRFPCEKPKGHDDDHTCRLANETATNLDEGKLWSFLRDVMTTGCAIETDTRSRMRGYEEHSARLDAAARDAVPQFFQRLGLSPKAGENHGAG